MRNQIRIPRQSFALSGLFFALLTLLPVAAGDAYAQTFKDVCPHAAGGLFDGPHPTDRTFEHDWQKDYPMLIYSMSGVVKKLQLQKAAADANTAKETAEANVRRNTTDANNDQLQKALVAATKVKTDADAVLKAFVSTGGKLYWKESNTKVVFTLTEV